jgi:hypothetical protein
MQAYLIGFTIFAQPIADDLSGEPGRNLANYGYLLLVQEITS